MVLGPPMPAAPATAPKRSEIWSWALYDWANSAFATTVLAGFFPLFYKQHWAGALDVTESTYRLGLANSFAGAIIAVSAPVLGAIADAGSLKKRLLAVFAALGIASTAALSLIGPADPTTPLIFFGAASVGFMAANVFYDALIVDVQPEGDRSRVSALGYALGYLGGGLLFALNVAMVLGPERFGLPDAAAGVRVSFASVSVWWALFSLPLLLVVQERVGASRGGVTRAVVEGFSQLRHTLGRARRLRPVWLFLVAYFLYIDGVDTIIRMAVDYGLSLGLESSDLITALLITQLVGFPAALGFGKLGTRLGAKAGVLLGLAVYVVVTVWAALLDSALEFYILAALVGLTQGGVQALSRALYASLIPPDESGEFFGFYNMLGKFAAVLGPALVGVTGKLTGSPRAAILIVLLLIGAGAAMLGRVRVEPVSSGGS